MATSATAVAIAAMSSPPSPSSSSPTARFLGHLRLPEHPSNLDNNALEFHESDVLWSSSSDLSDTPSPSPSPSPSNVSNSPSIHRQFHHHQYKSGLYAALSDDQHPLIRRKPTTSPSLSAATAARTIPPVTLMRSSGNQTASPKYHQSAPVNVPIWPKKASSKLGHFDETVDDVAEEEEEMVPPHEMVARSYMTFSVFEGAGRTLKGRDLRRVRNAVFQKTGFLD